MNLGGFCSGREVSCRFSSMGRAELFPGHAVVRAEGVACLTVIAALYLGLFSYSL